MTRIESIDRNTAKMLHKEMTEAMTAVAEKYGLSVQAHNGKYSTDQYSTKFTLVATPEGKSVDQSNWDKYCEVYGFKTEDFGRAFTDYRGKTWTISGLKPTRTKNNILVTNTRGTRYVMPSAAVLAHLKRS